MESADILLNITGKRFSNFLFRSGDLNINMYSIILDINIQFCIKKSNVMFPGLLRIVRL